MHTKVMDKVPKIVSQYSYEETENKGEQQHGCSAGQSSAVSAAVEKT